SYQVSWSLTLLLRHVSLERPLAFAGSGLEFFREAISRRGRCAGSHGDLEALRGPDNDDRKGYHVPFEDWVVSHARVSKKPHKKATLEDTLTFFHQLSTLVNSGMPLLQSLKIATGQCESTKFRAVLEQITAKVASGSTFYSSAAAFPEHFEFQWIEAIRTGEITGKMALVLVEL